MKIVGRHFDDQLVTRIQREIELDPSVSRRALSRQVCLWLDWRNEAGKLKEMSCRVALGRLHQQGRLQLPPVDAFSGSRPKRIPSKEKPPAGESVACLLPQLGAVEIIRVGSRHTRFFKVWKELMDQHHPLGSRVICGAQIRYLLRCDRSGWLGGLSFSAASWRLAARDKWIGWTEQAREANLSRVVNNSRFLIRPDIQVPNLASHVLGRCTRRVVVDWKETYGYAPLLLETFVNEERYRGTSYRAANWIPIGFSCGRTRNDQDRDKSVPRKAVYVYPLCRAWKQQLQAHADDEGVLEKVDTGVDPATEADWIHQEFGRVHFNDERLRQRLFTLAHDFGERPTASLPEACGSTAKTKAAYRFFKHGGTNMHAILRSHYQATITRMRGQQTVLAAQDSTALNYSSHKSTENLGPIGTQADGPQGLWVHDTMAYTLDGIPLGLLNVQSWAREAEAHGKKNKRKEVPIEQKESYKWLKSFEAAADAQKHSGVTQVVSIGDREADIYELFMLGDERPGVELLVRAQSNRVLQEEQQDLTNKLRSCAVAGYKKVQITARKGRAAREANLAVRFTEVTLKPPYRSPKARSRKLKPVTLWAISACEDKPPRGQEPISWTLLTTLRVNDLKEAKERVDWYALRWGIEVYHKTLKSGCRIEDRRLGSADRLECCLAIDMVVAWRVYRLAMLGRSTPNVPCTVFFDEAEWKTLMVYSTRKADPPQTPPTLGVAMRLVAQRGGFLGRKTDGDPGPQTIWKGLRDIKVMAEMWRLLQGEENSRDTNAVASDPYSG